MSSVFRPHRGSVVLSCAVALSLAAAMPARALTFTKQEFICPIGGQKFIGTVVMSYTQFGMRLDLRPFGAMLVPIPMPVCPDNGFVLFKESFSDGEIAVLTPIVLADEYKQARQRHTDYYMAAYLRERTGATDIELANLYLKASWEAENVKGELVDQYRALALGQFDKFLQRLTAGSDGWWTAALVAAELERLGSRFEVAQARLDALPIDELKPDAVEREVAAQIKAHVAARDSAPHEFAKQKR
jgi:hypothetical protein